MTTDPTQTCPDDGGPAFPTAPSPGYPGEYGMSMRDWFAGTARHEDLSLPTTIAECAAMIGVLVADYDSRRHWPRVVSRARYLYADEMLRERYR